MVNDNDIQDIKRRAGIIEQHEELDLQRVLRGLGEVKSRLHSRPDAAQTYIDQLMSYILKYTRK